MSRRTDEQSLEVVTCLRNDPKPFMHLGEADLSVHELQPEAVEARLRAGKKTPNLGNWKFI